MKSERLEYKWLGRGQAFSEALALQEELVKERQLDRTLPGQFLFLEHSPTYTIGLRKEEANLPSLDLLPHPVSQINRGGLATYHGPGQLVGYAIMDLNPVGKDLHEFLRKMEEALILTSQEFGVPAQRRDGLTGVWVKTRKMASMGVGVRKWVTMHGFALNITPESLPPFRHISPCGIDGVQMTCLHDEGEKSPSSEDFSKRVYQYFLEQFDL